MLTSAYGGATVRFNDLLNFGRVAHGARGLRAGAAAGTTLTDAVRAEIGASLAATDAELARRYPGDPGTRQPVHTVYVPADAFTAGTVRDWGDQALAALDEHAPDAAALAGVLGLPDALAAEVYDRVRAKLEREPVEDLRIDFEDGYGPRPDAEEDAAAVAAAAPVTAAVADGGAPPYVGIRMKCMEAAVRDRGIRTLDLFLTALLDGGGLPDGLRAHAAEGDLPGAGRRDGAAVRGVRAGRAACPRAGSASRSRSRPPSRSSAPTAPPPCRG